MGYIGREKKQESLPAKAQHFKPENGFPIEANNRERLKWECPTCSYVFYKSWDQMSSDNVDEHCGVCRYMKNRVSHFNQLDIPYEIVMYRYEPKYDREATPEKTWLPKLGAEVKIACKYCGNESIYDAEAIRNIPHESSSSNGTKLLQCEVCVEKEALAADEKHLQENQNSKQIERAYQIWGESISILATSTSFDVKVPSFAGVFPLGKVPIEAISDPKVTGRLKGPLKGSLSEKRLSELLDDDERLVATANELIERSKSFGATLLYVCYRAAGGEDYKGSGCPEGLPKKSGVYYCYVKATKSLSNWQSFHRVVGTNFGRTEIKADQLMILCVLSELFPLNEYGEAVEWREDRRDVFDGLELDISTTNLLPEMSGIQCEYQGHQNHRECKETMRRDEQKRNLAQGLYIEIPRINHMNAKKALAAVTKVIDDASHEEKNKFVELMNDDPSVDKISEYYNECLPERSMAATKKLKKNIAELGHMLLDEQAYYIGTVRCRYQCGNCGTPQSSYVNYLANSMSRNCRNCFGDLAKDSAQSSRTTSIRQGYADPELIEKPLQLIDLRKDLGGVRMTTAQRKKEEETHSRSRVECAECGVFLGAKHYVESVNRNGTFICPCCINTGELIDEQASNPVIIGSLCQNIEALIKVFQYLNALKPFEDIRKSLSLTARHKNTLTPSGLALSWKSDKGHLQTFPVSKWVGLIAPNEMDCYCEKCRQENQSLQRLNTHDIQLREFHPKANYLFAPKKGTLTEASCNELTKVGKFTIKHPNFFANPTKVNNEQKSKGSGEYSPCMCCAEEHGWNIPGSDKTLEQLTARFQIRAANVATFLGTVDINSVKISVVAKSASLKDVITGKDFLSFQCQNKNHKPTVSNYGNFFNLKRNGYCKDCLKAAGVRYYRDLL